MSECSSQRLHDEIDHSHPRRSPHSPSLSPDRRTRKRRILKTTFGAPAWFWGKWMLEPCSVGISIVNSVMVGIDHSKVRNPPI
ncbi:hypothetical protein BU25DRAFT_217320 [Macroventuria anomochaeta]|uniref:Uncharacterized protein n=1 Tax=Macroventuria anomochaeta TaxID=301207 RepID=A0ACB6RLA6_9PLEO|nr:uncharacterized protein BU25DRAFT_217320 [Macroventuria anomochaeta]KAF2622180.1 hypothetical protein BU25DRAFT_217320 [Macroventuria anomochaeta]